MGRIQDFVPLDNRPLAKEKGDEVHFAQVGRVRAEKGSALFIQAVCKYFPPIRRPGRIFLAVLWMRDLRQTLKAQLAAAGVGDQRLSGMGGSPRKAARFPGFMPLSGRCSCV